MATWEPSMNDYWPPIERLATIKRLELNRRIRARRCCHPLRAERTRQLCVCDEWIREREVVTRQFLSRRPQLGHKAATARLADARLEQNDFIVYIKTLNTKFVRTGQILRQQFCVCLTKHMTCLLLRNRLAGAIRVKTEREKKITRLVWRPRQSSCRDRGGPRLVFLSSPRVALCVWLDRHFLTHLIKNNFD